MPILNLGPTSNTAQEVPFTQWRNFAESFCVKGERKPAYGASLSRQGLNPSTWLAVYEAFKTVVASYPQASGSTILAEYYPVQKAVAIGNNSTSYPFRDVPIHVVAIPQYVNNSLDGVANTFGERVRNLLRATDGLTSNST